jgi:hypothetical protein
MLQINGVRERMNVVMKTASRFVEALSAGEATSASLSRRRGFEGGRLIHAIVDHKERTETTGEGHRRRRVVPEDVIADLVIQEEFIEQERLFYRERFRVIRPLAQTRRHDPPQSLPLMSSPGTVATKTDSSTMKIRRPRADRLIRCCGLRRAKSRRKRDRQTMSGGSSTAPPNRGVEYASALSLRPALLFII